MAIVLVLTAVAWAQREREDDRERSDRRPEGRRMADRNRGQRDEHRREKPGVRVFRFKHIPAETFIGVIEQLSRKSPLGEILSKIPVALCEHSNAVVVIAPPEPLELFEQIAEGIDQPSEFHERMARRNRPAPPRSPRVLRKPGGPKARGVSPQAVLTPRYRNKEYLRASAIQPLGEIAKLPMALADDLDTLVRRAAASARGAAKVSASTEGHRVKYFEGVNHLHHGLLENGVGELASKPSTDFTEHCFDRDGKLAKAIARRKDGTRFVSRIFLYEGDLPGAMLTFGPKGYSGSYGLYRDGRLVLVAEIDSGGKVRSCECIFYTCGREDYSVRYVAKQTDSRFTVSDLRLAAIALSGVRLEFKKTGELERLMYYNPLQATNRTN